MGCEWDVSTFMQGLAAVCFEERDMQAMQEYLEKHTSLGYNEDKKLSYNLEKAGYCFLKEISGYQGSFTCSVPEFDFVSLSEKEDIVYGMLVAAPSERSLLSKNIRMSAVIVRSGEGLTLVHVIFIQEEPQQEKKICFSEQFIRADNQSLRQELNMRERQLADLTKNIPGGAHQTSYDPNLTLLSVSDGFLAMFGYTREEIDQQFDGKFINMIYPGDRVGILRIIYQQLEKGVDLELEYRVLCKNGQPVWVLDKGRLIRDVNGNSCFYCVLIDITKRKRQEEELRLSLERHQVIMDQAADIIFEWDLLQDTLEFSSNWRKKFGYDAIDKKISGRIPFSRNIHPDDIPAFIKIMNDTAAGILYSETEFRIRSINGRFYWCRIRATTQFNSDGQPVKAVGVIADIDEEKRQKEALIEQAQYDTLTGIYNKATINVLVEQRMRRTDKTGSQALLIIDVDHFKAVNDTYGHLCGDSVLSDLAAALKGSTRSSDLVGRIGGDEFLVYLPEVKDEEAVRMKTERILDAVSYIRPEQGAASITCSIGAIILPHGELDYQTLYQYADRALYQQKNNGRSGGNIWTADTVRMAGENGESVSAVGNTIVSDEGNVVEEWLAQYVFRSLYEARDIKETLNRLLEIIGRSFNVSRVYIFEFSPDAVHGSTTFEWCSDGVTRLKESQQNVTCREDMETWQTNFSKNGMYYCHNIESLHPAIRDICKLQGVRFMLQCAVLDEGRFMGCVGFEECREKHEWGKRQISSFKLTADVLSSFLVKLRLKER